MSKSEGQIILDELRNLNSRIDVLNTRLFGNPEGEAGDEGRLTVSERRLNVHSKRLEKLEYFKWLLLGGLIVGDALITWFLSARH